MNKITSIEFPFNRDPEELERRLRWLIQDDFQPFGHAFLLGDQSICQPMIKYQEDNLTNTDVDIADDADIKAIFDSTEAF